MAPIGKKPPARSVSRQPVTLLLRTTRIWGRGRLCVVDPGINKRIGRIYPTPINGDQIALVSPNRSDAPEPRHGRLAGEAKQAFKRRYQEVKGRT
jgi:hypothetical protein